MIFEFADQVKDNKVKCIVTGYLIKKGNYPVMRLETKKLKGKTYNSLSFFINHDYEKRVDEYGKEYVYKKIIKCDYFVNTYRRNMFNFLKDMQENTEVIIFGYLNSYIKKNSEILDKVQTITVETIVPLEALIVNVFGKVDFPDLKWLVQNKKIETKLFDAPEKEEKYKF